MLRYGIPSYSFPKERLQYDLDAILATGIDVKLNVDIGGDIKFEKLKKRVRRRLPRHRRAYR